MLERKMVLFDWNNTLVNDGAIWYASVKEVFSRQNLLVPSPAEYFTELEKQTKFTDAYKALGITLSEDEINEIYERAYRERINGIQLSAGVMQTLKKLQEMGIILGVISAQLRNSFELVFTKFKLDSYFKHVITDALRKNVVISHLCAQEMVARGNCYFVGDAPFDIVNAKKAGIKSVAYLTDFMPKELLLFKNPDFVISDLRELPKIIRKECNG